MFSGVIATRPQAIGRTPVLNEGATGKAAVFTAVYGDGRRLPAVQMPGSREFVDPQTGLTAIAVGSALPGIGLPVGLGILALWELIAALGCFALAKGLLHHSDMPSVKTG